MASLSKAVKNKTRRKLIAKFADKRMELKRTIRSPKSTTEDVAAAQKKLRALPRDSSKTHYRNRCKLTGRPRAFLRKFGLSRIAFRELSLAGEIPGVIKSSW